MPLVPGLIGIIDTTNFNPNIGCLFINRYLFILCLKFPLFLTYFHVTINYNNDLFRRGAI